MMTLDDYWMGRDRKYTSQLTSEVRDNAKETVRRVVELLELALQDGIVPAVDQVTGTHVSSGWRPAAVNDRTRNAAKGSKHLSGLAVDLQDHADRRLARWCLRNQVSMTRIGLWMEDPRWTGGRDPWVHLQTVAPGSGRRVFIPSTQPATSPPLPEQQ